MRIVKKFQPSVFLIENVPGILTAAPEGTHIKDRIANDIKKLDISALIVLMLVYLI